jgi:hypothetical protein
MKGHAALTWGRTGSGGTPHETPSPLRQLLPTLRHLKPKTPGGGRLNRGVQRMVTLWVFYGYTTTKRPHIV